MVAPMVHLRLSSVCKAPKSHRQYVDCAVEHICMYIYICIQMHHAFVYYMYVYIYIHIMCNLDVCIPIYLYSG